MAERVAPRNGIEAAVDVSIDAALDDVKHRRSGKNIDARRPVLLVHGILGQRHVYWNIFRNRLLKDGFRVHEVILPYYMLGDIRIAAQFLKDKVDASRRGDGIERVDLVCHSAGGLVARYYIKYLRGDKHVNKLLTLGTPHLGTYFAYALNLPFLGILRQTRPGSHFLDEINGPGAVPPSVKFVSFWSQFDGVVIPSENAILPGAHNVKVPWVGHWGYLWRQDIYRLVRDALEEEGAQATLDRGYGATQGAATATT